jgi:BirA family biotin operon repressor/biotin-[acetyl-CoA-carboxylase] ligase
MRLHPAAVAAGVRLAAHETLTSTNTEALAAARRGERGPLWVTAQQQTSGRGRRGNEWISPPGNLYASVLLNDPAPPEHAPELSFVAALATYDAILDCAPALREKLALKWPNDILCGGAKFTGILIEGEGVERGMLVVVGIGVNCRHHPPPTNHPTSDLAAAGADVTAESLFAALSGTMLRRLTQWRRGAGFDVIRADWLKRATGISGELRVRLPNGEFSGSGEGMDERGRLLVRLAGGSLRTVTAGDVFPLGDGPAAGAPAKGRAG